MDTSAKQKHRPSRQARLCVLRGQSDKSRLAKVEDYYVVDIDRRSAPFGRGGHRTPATTDGRLTTAFKQKNIPAISRCNNTGLADNGSDGVIRRAAWPPRQLPLPPASHCDGEKRREEKRIERREEKSKAEKSRAE